MELTKRNIALIIICFLLFLVISMLILIFIWKPPFIISNSFKYIRYTEQEAQDKICKKYTEIVSRKIINKDLDWLYKNTAEEYLKNKEITREGFRMFLLKNELYPFYNDIEAGKYNYYKNGDTTIYEVQFKINGKIKIINIIETSPDKFYISYGSQTFEEKTEKKIKGSLNGIEVEMNRTYKDKESEIYEVFLTNTLEQTVEFEFLDVTNIKLKDKEELNYNLNSDVSSAIDEPLYKGTKIKKEMTFLIPAASQPNIKYIVFYEVKINGENQTLKIELK